MIVSRGELIEIGDGFRILDVLARSGRDARRGRDDEPHTPRRLRAGHRGAHGSAFRVHQSNFRIIGFTEHPSVRDLARLADRHGLPLVDDPGSGALVETLDEPTARASIEAGAHVVTFSGDKPWAGPQAGLVVGRADLIERMRRHPLQRALRADKDARRARGHRLLCTAPACANFLCCACSTTLPETVRARAERLAGLTGGTVEQTVARWAAARPLAEIEPAPARSSSTWRSRCGSASRRSSGSSATTGSYSTAGRWPTQRSTRSRRPWPRAAQR